MKYMSKLGIVLVCLLSINVLIAKPFFSTNPMYVPQIDPTTGMSNPLFLKLDNWLSQTFGLNERYLRNTDSIAGKKSYFIVKRDKDGTVNVSKKIRLKGHDLDLFYGKNFRLFGPTQHPAFPNEIIQHFQSE